MKHTPEEIKYRLSDLGVQIGNIAIEYITKLEKKNADLKADNDARKFAMTMSEKVEKQLREENTELENDMKTAVSLLERSVEISESLTKAKEIIKKMLYEYQRLCLIKKETIAEVEQFLNSEVENE